MRTDRPGGDENRGSRSPPVATTLLATGGLALALYVSAVPIRAGPPLGRFLDPVHGVWSVATHAELPARESHQLAGAARSVDVRFDDRAVPHIFAANEPDVWRALGYVHARDRLFQMEIQTRAVAGTLSELLGTRTLEVDREARAQGLAWSAERAFRELDPNSDAVRAARAYADGVNTFIEGMTSGDYPLEYHLLGARPQRWEPRYSAYLLARMGLTLAYTDGELQRAQVEALVGKPAAAALFPENAPIVEPIQPNGQRAPRFDFIRIPPPQRLDSAKLATATEIRHAMDPFGAHANIGDEIAVGSNNWAVSPRRSASGHALLAGDPHLNLSLPSIWYEAHLVVPDTLDVYGVTLIGSPFITIGFNRDVAWTFTNTGADVTDYYAETVDNDAHPTRYKLDGEWKTLEARIETVRARSGAALATDTIYHTHRGPMQRWGKTWVSRRWTVLEPHNTMDAFRRANLARSAAELLQAFEGYEVAAQNVLTADRAGHIAIRSNGHFPIRGGGSAPKGAARDFGRGDVVRDGSSSANDWTGYWPIADYPQSFDPPQGFLSSNNQQPKDPRVDPRYLGWDWPAPWRAMRINALLRADSAVTPDAMRRWQTDPVSEQTTIFLRAFLHAADSSSPPVDSSVARAAHLLAEWDGRFTKDNERAVLYSTALDELARRTWDELGVPGAPPEDRVRRVATPNSMILAELLDDPTNAWWDIRSTTDVVEDRDTILRQSLAAAYDRVVKIHGEPGPAWRWEKTRRANINHLLRIPAFSRLGIPMQAGPGTLSPSAGGGTHGASWRMVVELGPEVRAWGTYPGGQSGNPASSRYTDRLPKWTAGDLDTLRFPRRASDLAGRTLTSSLTLTPVTSERKQ
ncbi:MAG TPA: penicillin acylase family protein [Gemmatimonadaceae bacterium]|nr:penicillin acylase family protein [Gemmatimonadaceae bacterium]